MAVYLPAMVELLLLGFLLAMDENPAADVLVMSSVQKNVTKYKIQTFAVWVRTCNVFMSIDLLSQLLGY